MSRARLPWQIAALTLVTSLFAASTALAPGASAAPDSGVPTLGCDGNISRFSTGVDASGNKYQLNHEGADYSRGSHWKYGQPDTPTKDLRWTVASNGGLGFDSTPGTQPPLNASYEPAQVSGWSAEFTQQDYAQWISSAANFTQSHLGSGRASFYYRLDFEILDQRVADNLQLRMTYRAEGTPNAVWVNGNGHQIRSGTESDPSQMVTKWFGAGEFKLGLNTLIVQVTAEPGKQGFQTSFGVTNRYEDRIHEGEQANLCNLTLPARVTCSGTAWHLSTGLTDKGRRRELEPELNIRGVDYPHLGSAELTELDPRWEIAGDDWTARAGLAGVAGKPPAASLPWRPAVVGGWITDLPSADGKPGKSLQDINSQWITSYKPFMESQTGPSELEPKAFYYRLKFDVESQRIADNMNLVIRYSADDELGGMWINGQEVPDAVGGIRQSAHEVTIESGLRQGNNELVVQVLSWPNTQAFRAHLSSRPKDAAVNAKNANDYYCPQPAAPTPVAPTPVAPDPVVPAPVVPAPASNEAASPTSDPTKAAKPTAAAKPTNLPATGD